MTFSIIVLACLVASLALCLVLRTRLAACCLVVSSALWLPANNTNLEGTTLFGIGATHGVTTSDLLAVGGLLVGVVTLLWRSRRDVAVGRATTRPAAIIYLCAAIFGVGAIVAYLRG